MKKFRFAIGLICVLTLIVIIPQVADASEGKISVSMKDMEKPVADGTLTIYHIADMVENAEAYEFPYVDEWAECAIPLEDLQSAELAEDLADFAVELKIEGLTKKVDKEGNVTFDQLTDGLYLLVQRDAADGYHAVNPFLVTVPGLRDGEVTYDIDASPKVELIKKDTEDKKGTSGTSSSKLYQTGQLNWPVPVLAVSGLLLFAIGWYLCFAKKEK